MVNESQSLGCTNRQILAHAKIFTKEQEIWLGFWEADAPSRGADLLVALVFGGRVGVRAGLALCKIFRSSKKMSVEMSEGKGY